MRNLTFTHKKTGEVKNITVPNCISNAMIEGSMAAGLCVLGMFFYGLVEDGIDLAKKLFKK